jgi:starch synthase
MWPRRSIRWSRPAAWPMWWRRCRWRWPRPGADVRLLLPGLPAVLDAVQHARTVVDIGNCFGACACACCWGACRAASCRCTWSMRPTCTAAGGPYQAPRRRGVARQPAALRPAGLGGRPPGRRRCRPAVAARHRARARLACRHGLRLHRRPCRHAGRRRSSRCTTWPSRACSRCTTGPAGAGVALHVAGRAGVPRPAVVHEGRAEVRRPRDHGEPQLRARDRDARVRLRPGRRDPRPRRVSGILNGIDDRRSGTRPPTAPSPPLRRRAPAGQAGLPACAAGRTGAGADDDALLLAVVSRLTGRRGWTCCSRPARRCWPQGVQLAVQGTGDAGAGGGLPHGGSRPTRPRARAHRLRRGARTA